MFAELGNMMILQKKTVVSKLAIPR